MRLTPIPCKKMSLEVSRSFKRELLNRNAQYLLTFLQDTKHSPFQRQRNILYLISQFLTDFGLKQTKATLWNEAALSPDYKICDNIDLDTIYLDFCSYYHVRFGKLPKILKRMECEINDTPNSKLKPNKMKTSDNTTKVIEECQKKVKKESPKDLTQDFVVSGSVANVGDSNSDESIVFMTKCQRSVGLFEQFSGEWRDLAHIIERLVSR